MFFKVKVYPKEKNEEVIKKSSNSFVIKIKEAPKNNQANKKLLEILSDYFQIDISKIRLIRGGNKQIKSLK